MSTLNDSLSAQCFFLKQWHIHREVYKLCYYLKGDLFYRFVLNIQMFMILFTLEIMTFVCGNKGDALCIHELEGMN